jgi:hypothetical protein
MNAVAEAASAAPDETTTTPDGIVLKRSLLYKGLAKLSASLVQLAPDATDHAIVYCPVTGLMKAINAPGFLPSDGDQYPDELIERAKRLDHAGFRDWTIPNVHQQILDVDYSRTGPAADTVLYPDAVSDIYLCQQTQWTLGKTRSSRSFWGVYVYYGVVYGGSANGRFRARPVRVAAPAGQWLVIGQ